MEAVKNNSGWRPTGSAALLRAFELAEKKGRLVIPDSVEQSFSTCDTMGIVVALGADCWTKPGETPRAKIGDKVLFTQYTGGLIKGRDGYTYRMVPCHALYAVEDVE